MTGEGGGRRAPRWRRGRAAALSRSGEPRSARAPAGPRREFGERRGCARRVADVRAHTLAHACCLHSLCPPGPSFALRGRRGAGGGREGAGLREWRGSRRPRVRQEVSHPLAGRWGHGGSSPRGRSRGLTSAARCSSCCSDSSWPGAGKGRLEAWVRPRQSAQMLREGSGEGGARCCKARGSERWRPAPVLESAQ